jgi:anti-sigma B factor antagonist
MPASEYPCQMIGDVPVVTAPAEIDATTSDQLRAILLEWHSRGHTAVVVDLTRTQYCDSAGMGELLRGHKRAAADGGGLWLVVRPDGAFMRVFSILGLHLTIPHFATLDQALAQVPAGVTRPQRCRNRVFHDPENILYQ